MAHLSLSQDFFCYCVEASCNLTARFFSLSPLFSPPHQHLAYLQPVIILTQPIDAHVPKNFVRERGGPSINDLVSVLVKPLYLWDVS